MSAQLIKRQDVPNAWQIGKRMPEGPKVRLHRSGTLFFSVVAVAALGEEDCRVMVEFEEESRTLKFTVPEKLPRGVELEDCFPMRIRKGPNNRRPIGMMSLRALFNYLGFELKAQDLAISAIDPASRSITLVLPSGANDGRQSPQKQAAS